MCMLPALIILRFLVKIIGIALLLLGAAVVVHQIGLMGDPTEIIRQMLLDWLNPI